MWGRPLRILQGDVSLGFTMLELMIVVAVVAILATIAIPSYQHYVVKTNRAAAEGCLSQYATYMERYYTTHLRYDQTLASGDTAAVPNPVTTQPPTLTLDCAGSAQVGHNYRITVPAYSATSYTVQAAPIGVQQTRDTQCGTLTLNQIGRRSNTGSGTLTQCWGG